MKHKRRPGPIHANAVQLAIRGTSRLPAEQVATLKAQAVAAVDSFKRGQDCESAWRDMADVLNVAEAMTRLRLCSDEASVAKIAGAHEVLGAVFERHRTRGSWTLYAPEIVALDEAVWLHGVQLEHCSLAELERAVKMVGERVRQALAGNAGRDVKVLRA